jgi:hypothetical protein
MWRPCPLLIWREPELTCWSVMSCPIHPKPGWSEPHAHGGLRTLTGLAMLVYQGAICLRIWAGHDAPAVAMKAALGQAFRSE